MVTQKMPFYIFCESYGGKMTAAFAEVLQEVSLTFLTILGAFIIVNDYL